MYSNSPANSPLKTVNHDSMSTPSTRRFVDQHSALRRAGAVEDRCSQTNMYKTDLHSLERMIIKKMGGRYSWAGKILLEFNSIEHHHHYLFIILLLFLLSNSIVIECIK